jgi:hypothetical protein
VQIVEYEARTGCDADSFYNREGKPLLARPAGRDPSNATPK